MHPPSALILSYPRNSQERSLERATHKPADLPVIPSDQMKPRTVYEKAVRDFTETAQQLARLNQHFRQASFAEFEMLMGLDDEVLKRYGLPKLTGAHQSV
jgi:hypothetical protein